MVTDEQLSSFRQRHGAFFTFSQSAPSEAGVVDHRNVVLFLFLLNGRKNGASGPLRIFESWFRPHRCNDLLIDDSGFGINAADMRVRLKALPNSEIRARQRLYIEMHVRRERPWRWFRRARMPTIRAVDEEGNSLEECFANLREKVDLAQVKSCWVMKRNYPQPPDDAPRPVLPWPKQANVSVTIVMTASSDPVDQGYVESLARPLGLKWQEAIKESLRRRAEHQRASTTN